MDDADGGQVTPFHWFSAGEGILGLEEFDLQLGALHISTSSKCLLVQKIEAEGTIELLCRFNIIESRFNDSGTSLLFVSSETESHPKIN
jgi:hypothetical protein